MFVPVKKQAALEDDYLLIYQNKAVCQSFIWWCAHREPRSAVYEYRL